MSAYGTDYVDYSKGLRLPSEAYRGKNHGFYAPMGDIIPADAEPRQLQAALARHRLAMYFLTQKDQSIPSLKEMQDDVAMTGGEEATLAGVQEQIAAVQAQHLEDLERMYELHAEEYLEEARDQYLARDDGMYLVEGENNPVLVESYKKLDSLYEDCRRSVGDVFTWEHDIAVLNHTYHNRLLPLCERRGELEALEVEERKRREADFPQTKEEFRAKGREVKQRAVMFLTTGADTAAQEKMLGEYGWAWRQVKPLMDVFEKDKAFNSEVIALRISIDMELKDPRKRVA